MAFEKDLDMMRQDCLIILAELTRKVTTTRDIVLLEDVAQMLDGVEEILKDTHQC